MGKVCWLKAVEKANSLRKGEEGEREFSKPEMIQDAAEERLRTMHVRHGDCQDAFSAVVYCEREGFQESSGGSAPEG